MHTVLAQQKILRTMAAECSDSLRPRVLSVLSNSFRTAGWISFNADDLPNVRRYYEQVRATAQDAGDAELAAMVLTNLSHAAESSGHPGIAVDHAAAARTWAARTDNAHLKAFASDISACAHAALGDYDTALRHLDDTATIHLPECHNQEAHSKHHPVTRYPQVGGPTATAPGSF